MIVVSSNSPCSCCMHVRGSVCIPSVSTGGHAKAAARSGEYHQCPSHGGTQKMHRR